jgi:hypothetical protein
MRNQHQPQPTAELCASIDALSAEVRVLRDVLDEVRDALQWRNKNVAELAEARLPALPVENSAADPDRGAEAPLARGPVPIGPGYIPEGYPLELRRERSGSYHYLADRRLQGGDLLEIWLPETGWTRARYEGSYPLKRQPWIYFDEQRSSVVATDEHCFRWPEA